MSELVLSRLDVLFFGVYSVVVFVCGMGVYHFIRVGGGGKK